MSSDNSLDMDSTDSTKSGRVAFFNKQREMRDLLSVSTSSDSDIFSEVSLNVGTIKTPEQTQVGVDPVSGWLWDELLEKFLLYPHEELLSPLVQ